MFSTGATFNAIIIFVFAGLLSGFIYDIMSTLKFLTKKNILVINVVDLLWTIVVTAIFIYCITINFYLFKCTRSA